MRKTCALTAVILLLTGLLAPVVRADDNGAKSKSDTVQWQNYHEAMADARDNHKPVLIHFTSTWSKWCQKMRTETYRDHRVIAYLDAHFATAWVDAGKFQQLARQYEVNALPTLWFLDADGKGLTSIDGFVPADKLLSVLKFIQTGSYGDMSFQAWTVKHLDRKY